MVSAVVELNTRSVLKFKGLNHKMYCGLLLICFVNALYIAPFVFVSVLVFLFVFVKSCV